MGEENKKPYILYVAEAIYLEIFQIKKQNIDISNLDAIERFMGSKLYEKVSSGKFHDEWFEKLKENDFVDETSGEKISKEVFEDTLERIFKIKSKNGKNHYEILDLMKKNMENNNKIKSKNEIKKFINYFLKEF